MGGLDRVKVGLVGCGYVSQFHLRAWQRIDNVDLVAVSDKDEKKAQGRASEFNIPEVYIDYRRMLDEAGIDVLDIATPPEIHLEMAEEAAQRGIHVLCQKPLAPSMEEAKRIVNACDEYGVRLMVNENWRWRIWYQEIKKLLDEGMIGEVFYCHINGRSSSAVPTYKGPRPFQKQPYFASMPRLILYENMIHLIDVCRFFFGECQSVYAQMRRINKVSVGEDMASLMLNMGRVLAIVERSWCSKGYPSSLNTEKMEIEGERGTIFLDEQGRIRVVIDEEDGREDIWPEYDIGDFYIDSYIKCQSHFIDSLLTGKEFQTSGRDNLKTLEITLRGYESAEKNQVIYL